MDIARQRLHTQHITGPGFATPADVVKWFGAVQAQDYRGALWALGLRTKGAVESDIEQAIADRTIVRSWPLRGTMHFVAPDDLRWMLTFFAARTIARAAPLFKQLELDDRVLARAANLIVKALAGGRQMSRPRIYALFERAGIATAGNRGIHILWRCAHDGLICFGAHDGRQPTFALLEEWVPRARAFDRDAALAELARRYVTSHGPATLADFTWWSGLAADAQRHLQSGDCHRRPDRRHVDVQDKDGRRHGGDAPAHRNRRAGASARRGGGALPRLQTPSFFRAASGQSRPHCPQ